MRAALISLGSESSKRVAVALRKYFDTVEEVDLKKIEVNVGEGQLDILYEGKPLEEFDCVYVKGSFRYDPIMRALATGLQGKTYTPIKPEAFSIGHDKVLTQLEMQRSKVPMPKTYLAASVEAARKILEKMNYPIVMKFPSGTQGKGVMFADSFASASSMLDALSALRQPFLIQEYLETGGVDTRVIVVGDRVVAAMNRHSQAGEKRANIHAGGTGTPIDVDNYTKKIAVTAAQTIGADVCAVDILESVKGPVVIELNMSPGLQGIMAATKIDIPDKIAKFLFDKAKEFKESGKKTQATKVMVDAGISKSEQLKEIISGLDFRGNRILLPEAVTGLTKFNEKEEYSIIAEKGSLEIRKQGNSAE